MKTHKHKIDRSAVMRDAHKRFRAGKRLRLGWTFAQCLTTAWAAARQRQNDIVTYHSAPNRARHDRPFPLAA